MTEFLGNNPRIGLIITDIYFYHDEPQYFSCRNKKNEYIFLCVDAETYIAVQISKKEKQETEGLTPKERFEKLKRNPFYEVMVLGDNISMEPKTWEEIKNFFD